jgi:hypothetical protein
MATKIFLMNAACLRVLDARFMGPRQLEGEADLPLLAAHHLVVGPDLVADSEASNEILEPGIPFSRATPLRSSMSG